MAVSLSLPTKKQLYEEWPLAAALGGLVSAWIIFTIWEPQLSITFRAGVISQYHRTIPYVFEGLFTLLASGTGILCYRWNSYRKFWVTGWWLTFGTFWFVLISIFSLRYKLFGILPFYAGIQYDRSAWVIMTLIGIAGLQLTVVYRNLKEKKTWFVYAMVLFAWVITVLSNGISGNLGADNTRIFNLRTVEYYSDISKVNPEFIFHYSKVMPDLNLHPSTHPPLAILFLWLLDRLGLGVLGSSLAVAFCGSLALLPAAGLARDLFGEKEATAVAAVFPLVPAVVSYSAVSLDAFFMLLGTLAAWSFMRTLKGSQAGVLCGFLFSLFLFSTFMAWFFLPLFFLIVLGIRYTYPLEVTDNRCSLKPPEIKTLAIWGGTVTAFYLGLYLVCNYNLIEVFLLAKRINDRMFASGLRTYSYWIWGNLADYLVYLGIPLSALLFIKLKELIKQRELKSRDVPLMAVVLTLLILNFSGLIKRETARVWLVFTPFLLAALSRLLVRIFGDDRRSFVVMSAALYSQALVFECFLDSLW